MLHKNQDHSLIDPTDSILIVIDVQNGFLKKLEPGQSDELLKRVCWLVEVAKWKQIPLLVTAEELDLLPLADELTKTLPANTKVFNKLVFGLKDQADIFAELQSSGRKTAVLVGLETDVCVAHSALGLLDEGYRVAVVSDATGTPAPNQKSGLRRMQNAGVILLNTKGLFYEWLRTVEMINRFHNELPHMRAQIGITL